jgi:RHS repeat-associated protein
VQARGARARPNQVQRREISGYQTDDRPKSRALLYERRPSATPNDTEKFTGYFRDGSTGLDYADQRYHQPGAGRFITPDAAPSASAADPGSWNRYAYVGGDPVNRVDPSGLNDEPPTFSIDVYESIVDVTAASDPVVFSGGGGPGSWPAH